MSTVQPRTACLIRADSRPARRCSILIIALTACAMLVNGACGMEAAGDRRAAPGDATAVDIEETAWATAKRYHASDRRSFFDFYEAVATVEPEQSERNLVASIGDVEFESPSGPIYIADPSEGNVKIYDMGGRLERVLGRKGEGPGEFTNPRFIEIGSDRRAYVVDPTQARVQVFDTAGAFLKNIPIRDLGGVRGFGMLSDGSFLFLTGGPRDVLIHTDSTARVLSRHLPIAGIRPEGQPDDGIWGYARNFFLDVRNDTAYVIASVSNRLWAVDVRTGEVSRSTVEFPTYAAPQVPRFEKAEKTAQNAMKEVMTYDLAGFIRTTRADILIPFIRGELLDGTITLLRGSSAGDWSVIDDSPTLIDSEQDYLVGVDHPATDAMKLTLYRPRR